MRPDKSRQKGAILLEAIIALMLFSLVGVALLNVTNQAMSQQDKIFEIRCANWLADNIMAIEFLDPPGERIHDKEGNSHQCGMSWSWEMKQRITNDSRFNLITLKIKNLDRDESIERQMLRYR